MISLETAERREGRRKDCDAKFTFLYRGQHREACLLNVSPTGGFIETPVAPPPGSVFVLEHYSTRTAGLRVRFVVEVVRTGEPGYRGAVDETARVGVGARWKRAYCNRGAFGLQGFLLDTMGFRIDVAAFARAHGAQADGEVIYNFEERSCELRQPMESGERSYRHPTRQTFLLIRDLPPVKLQATADSREERPTGSAAGGAESPDAPAARAAPGVAAGGREAGDETGEPQGGKAQAPPRPEPAAGPAPAAPPPAGAGAQPTEGEGAARSGAQPQRGDPGAECALVKLPVTFSVGNTYQSGVVTHVGMSSLRLISRAMPPPSGARVMVRFPTSAPESPVCLLALLTCRVAAAEKVVSGSGSAGSIIELEINSVDDGGNAGGFRKFVQRNL